MKTERKRRRSIKEQAFEGVGVSSGIAVGLAHLVESGAVNVPEYTIAEEQVAEELARFAKAVASAQKQIRKLGAKAAGLHGGMQFTYRRPERSTDPSATLATVRTLVVGARSYRRAGAAPRCAGPFGSACLALGFGTAVSSAGDIQTNLLIGGARPPRRPLN